MSRCKSMPSNAAVNIIDVPYVCYKVNYTCIDGEPLKREQYRKIVLPSGKCAVDDARRESVVSESA